MVEILQRQPSFGEMIGRGLGAGLGQGVSKASEFAAEMALQKQKAQQDLNLLSEMRKRRSGTGDQLAPKGQNQDISQKFIESVQNFENQTGQHLSAEQLDEAWNMLNQQSKITSTQEEDPFAEAEEFAALGKSDLAKISTERAKTATKSREAEISRGYEESKPTRTRGRELLEDLPYKENALETMRDAVTSGNLGMFSWDNLAELTGIEGLRSPEGASFKTASKEFFLGNLSRVGARGLNQMMERVVLEMSPLVGRKPEANLAVIEILNAENDVSRKEAELIHDISQNYKEKFGHYPDDLADRVYKELRPYAVQRQKDALSEVDKIKDKYSSKNKEGMLMYDPSGNLRRVPSKDQKMALKEGYRKA